MRRSRRCDDAAKRAGEQAEWKQEQDGAGFVLGFSVRNETGSFEVTGNAGEYYWAGAAGTGFYVDPKDGIMCVWMTHAQLGMPRRYDRYLFRQMVYQVTVK
jgi:CubicO group peptidase (beta-lactamase class C family)